MPKSVYEQVMGKTKYTQEYLNSDIQTTKMSYDYKNSDLKIVISKPSHLKTEEQQLNDSLMKGSSLQRIKRNLSNKTL